jgi:hypothetical protein
MNRIMILLTVVSITYLVASGCEESEEKFFQEDADSVQQDDYVGPNEENEQVADSGTADNSEIAGLSDVLGVQENISAAKLDTQDRVKIEGTNPYLYFVDPANNDWVIKDEFGRLKFYYYDSGWKNAITIDRAGDVGINTTSPNYKLDVKGTIRAEEVIVSTGWSDFVFEDDYKLRSLSEVEHFINRNGHLPDVPSAAEIKAKGVSVGDAQTVLLQKIEELTLYMIDQQKEIRSLKQQVKESRRSR